MYVDKQKIYQNARNFVKNYVEQRGEVTTKELAKMLKQQFSFNSNQVSGLLNKMSTTEKSIMRVRRGVYGPYKDGKGSSKRAIKYSKAFESFKDELSYFVNDNIGNISSKEFNEIQCLFVALDKVEHIISSHLHNNQ